MNPKLIWDRELGYITTLSSKDIFSGEDVVQRLDLYRAIEGHSGCVNTLRWNKLGSMLASGSDDKSIKIWDCEGTLLNSFETSHTGNIFGVEFLPGMDDRFVTSCAADCRVILTDIERKYELSSWETRGRVKKMATTHFSPKQVWSISEDQFVRLHDCRDHTAVSMFSLNHKGKTIDASPNKPYYIAVGSEHAAVAIYDQRKTNRPMIKLCPADKHIEAPLYVTHLQFSRKTNHILANYGRASLYLFNLDNDLNDPSSFINKIDKLKDTVCVEMSDVDNNVIDEESLMEQSSNLISNMKYMEAINLLTRSLKQTSWSREQKAMFFLKRADAYMKRKMEGDSYSSARDTVDAALLIPNDHRPIRSLISILLTMEQTNLALEVINLFKSRFPDEGAKDDIKEVEDAFDQLSRASTRPKDIRKALRSRRDYESRYTGHTNANTDIKEATFFGPNEEYIITGCDSGHIFIYNRNLCNIETLLKGDSSVTNIVQPHPFLPLIASSGLDPSILLWSPYNHGEMPLPSHSSRRIHYSQAEDTLTRNTTRNLIRELVLLQRLESRERPDCLAS